MDRRGRLTALAGALRLDVSDLAGQPYPPRGAEHAAVRAVAFHLRRRVLRWDPPTARGSLLDELAGRVRVAAQAEAEGDEDHLALALPELIDAADLAPAAATRLRLPLRQRYPGQGRQPGGDLVGQRRRRGAQRRSSGHGGAEDLGLMCPNIPRSTTFAPQFLLRRFADPAGRLIAYRVMAQKQYQATVANVGHRNFGHTLYRPGRAPDHTTLEAAMSSASRLPHARRLLLAAVPDQPPGLWLR